VGSPSAQILDRLILSQLPDERPSLDLASPEEELYMRDIGATTDFTLSLEYTVMLAVKIGRGGHPPKH